MGLDLAMASHISLHRICSNPVSSTDLGPSQSYRTKITDIELLMPNFQPLELTILVMGYAVHFTPTEWSSRSESWFRKQNPVIWAFFCRWCGRSMYANAVRHPTICVLPVLNRPSLATRPFPLPSLGRSPCPVPHLTCIERNSTASSRF